MMTRPSAPMVSLLTAAVRAPDRASRCTRFRALALLLVILMTGCSRTVHVGATGSIPPRVSERINEDAVRDQSVVELRDRVVIPSSLLLSADSVRWWEEGGERRLPVSELECILFPHRTPTSGERFRTAALVTLGAGAAMTTFFALTEDVEVTPALVVFGMTVNTFVIAPLAFPAGWFLAPRLTGSRTYDFRSAPDAVPSRGCGADR